VDSDPTIVDCSITDNDGAGISLYSVGQNTAVVINCRLVANGLDGVTCHNTDLDITNCLIAGNRGNGFWAYSSMLLNISSCTIVENAQRGFIAEECRTTIANSVIRDNWLGQIHENYGLLRVGHCNIEAGWPGTAVIDADPNFVTPGAWVDVNDPNTAVDPNDPNGLWVEGDYHLLMSSPCINAGDPDFDDPNQTDIDGQQRLQGGRVDMGADEFDGPIFVDDDAPDDPGPGDANVSDPLENGSMAHPFDMIQEGIGVAAEGEWVAVCGGVYTEGLDFSGKAITVASFDEPAVLRAPGFYAVRFFHGEDANSLLRNFIITDSYAGFLFQVASPAVSNVTVVDCNIGAIADEGAQPHITNSIFWDNMQEDLFLCGARYSCIERGSEELGSISINPSFVDPCNRNYHLKSAGWRWAGSQAGWTWDDVTSRCVDSGNPGTPLRNELLSVPRDPNNMWGRNVRVEMGAYGGTSQASMPPNGWALLADLNNDGIVDWRDVGRYAECWLSADYEPAGDLNRDGLVNMVDWALMLEDWQQETVWK
jgi:hypothetical protein